MNTLQALQTLPLSLLIAATIKLSDTALPRISNYLLTLWVVFLCHFGCTGTHPVDLTGLELTNFYFKNIYFMFMRVCMSAASRQELQFQTFVSLHVGAGNQARIL